MFHKLNPTVQPIEMPTRFNNPFYYDPHPLCQLAAKAVQEYLTSINHEEGKMFGVMLVKSPTGELGYLAAFSGLLNGSNHHPYFVPPVYDLLQEEGYFKKEESNISGINQQIKEIENSEAYKLDCSKLLRLQNELEAYKVESKQQLKQAKTHRDSKRSLEISDEEKQSMIRESQFMKAEFKRRENAYKQQIEEAQSLVNDWKFKIEQLKRERKQRSAALQHWLFTQYKLQNSRGETKTLIDIFEKTNNKIPPGGSAECAGPKLLQYAYLNKYVPLAMAEFWWGKSPVHEIRKAGNYYPACNDKCKPILTFMLDGVEIDENPLEKDQYNELRLEILFEDDSLVIVHKPEGILSVPGKQQQTSVYSWAKKQYPHATGPLKVHRLDMDTSGILVIAKTKEVHKLLQEQFASRTVSKKYVAIIQSVDVPESGVISLPLCCDPTDRPRQVVNTEHGKSAITKYEVIEKYSHTTKIAFYPITGRTHQLRVHAAHHQGLNAPIVGDNLYGTKNKRLFLHAERISFVHPQTNQMIVIERKSDF